MSVHILTTGRPMELVRRRLGERFLVHALADEPDPAALLARIGPQVRGLATGGHGVDAALIGALPGLEIIANFGVGYDAVDVAAAAARGIIVTNTPDVLTEEVADTAMGLLLMTVRQLSAAERWLRAGNWRPGAAFPLSPASLTNRRLGILGYGRIGRAIARRAAAFGLPVAYHSRRRVEDAAEPWYPTAHALAEAVDTLIVVAPGGAATFHLVDEAVLRALGPSGILVNVGRGTVVDEAALVRVLEAGALLGAGLDVFENEPDVHPGLLARDDVVLLPHVGSASVPTREAMGGLQVDNLMAWFDGRGPLTPVPETPWRPL